MIKQFTIGSDPEVALIGHTGPVSSDGILGSKTHKHLRMELDGGFNIHEDNVMLEYNIPPASSKEQFVSFHDKALALIREKVPAVIDISNEFEVEYSNEIIETENAQVFGCEGDECIYPNYESVSYIPTNKRYAGGHIHIGYPGENEADSLNLIGWLDYYVGLNCVLEEPKNTRRDFYGKAGTYRRQAGIKIEYRTPSNYWIFSPEKREIMYDRVSQAVQKVNEGAVISAAVKNHIRQAIDTNNKFLAKRILTWKL